MWISSFQICNFTEDNMCQLNPPESKRKKERKNGSATAQMFFSFSLIFRYFFIFLFLNKSTIPTAGTCVEGVIGIWNEALESREATKKKKIKSK